MSLLMGGERSIRFGYGCDQGFVIGEKDDLPGRIGNGGLQGKLQGVLS
jgi:hypothetical protein